MFTISQETAGQPEAVGLIAQLDKYQNALYPAASAHTLDLSQLGDESLIFLMIRHETGRAVGCGSIVLYPDYGEIKRVFILAEYRRRGLGDKLLMALEYAAVGKGVSLLRLETGVEQPSAVTLYQRNGYHFCSPFPPYQADPLSHFMEKIIQ